MRKLRKFLFSKTFLVGILVIAQIALVIAINLILANNYRWFNIGIRVLSFIIFIALVNSDAPASHILPWITVIILSPIIGFGIYITMGRKNVSKKMLKKYQSIKKVKIEENINYQLLSDRSKYIQNVSGYKAYQDTSLKYLPTGEDFFEQLKLQLSKAKKYIFMEYFIIEKGKMWNDILEILLQKVKEGVDVKILFDSMGCGPKLPINYCKKLKMMGIDCHEFNRFIPIVSSIHNNRDHRKITIVDGIVGFVGGSNLADEYINVTHPYGKWRDNNILLKGEAVNNLLLMFIDQYNVILTKKETELSYDDYLNKDLNLVKSSAIVHPFACGPTPLYEQRIGEAVYLNMINEAKRYIHITSPYFIVDTYFLEALVRASKRGVDVCLMLPHIPDGMIQDVLAKSAYKKLIQGGVKVYEFMPGFIHSKSAVCDDECALIGTINLDYRSFVHHFECGIYIEKTPVIHEMEEDFQSLISSSCARMESIKMGIFKKIIRNIMKIFSPMF